MTLLQIISNRVDSLKLAGKNALSDLLLSSQEKELLQKNDDFPVIKQESQLLDLPLEIQLYIFSFLPANDLCKASMVSRAFRDMSQNEWIWHSKFDEEKAHWNSIENCHSDSSDEMKTWSKVQIRARNIYDMLFKSNNIDQAQHLEQSPSPSTTINQINWKRVYLRHKQENEKALAPQTKEASSKVVHTIPLFGEGMDTGGGAKALLYRMMWNPNSPFKMSGLYPGVEGIGSGVGFDVGSHRLCCSALYKYEDRGVITKNGAPLRLMWQEFFKKASGFIFVVDLLSTIEIAKAELDTFLSETASFGNQPLLVLACGGRNSAVEEESKKYSAIDIAEQLGLNESSFNARRWCIRTVHVETMEGIWEGLHWLTTQLP